MSTPTALDGKPAIALPVVSLTEQPMATASDAADGSQNGPPPQERPRLFYMDSMRTMMMLGIVVLHASNIYAPYHNWVVNDPQQSPFYNWMVDISDTFKLQVFFIIAGFFAAMSIKKHGIAEFAKTRALRIAVPLICTGLTVNTVELYLRTAIKLGGAPNVLTFCQTTLPQSWTDGAWISHLWFLVTLMQFFAVAPLALMVGRWLMTFPVCQRAVGLLRRNCLFLLLLPLVRSLELVLDKLHPEIYQAHLLFGTISIDDFLSFIPYFLVGLWLFTDDAARHEFATSLRWQAVVYVPVLVGYLMLRHSHGANAATLSKTYLEGLLHCLNSQFCFAIFYRYFNREIPVFRKLSDMSYTIYLFHHILVIGVGFVLIHVSLPIVVKFTIVVLCGLGLPILLHRLVIRKVPLLLLMYNGKRA